MLCTKVRAKTTPSWPFSWVTRRASGNVLRRDHLSHHSPGGVGRREENWAQVELTRRDHLQITEERIAGGVTAGQCHRKPAEERREQHEEVSG